MSDRFTPSRVAPSDRFAGRSALVTGAGSGIGRAVAVMLAEQGAAVAVTGLGSSGLDEVVAAITARGGRAIAVAADVTRPEEMEAAVDRAVAEFGSLDLAVNNAGVAGAFAPTGELSPSQWRESLAVDLDGVFHSLRYELPAMAAAGGGAIVNVSSIFAHRHGPTAAYTAAKHGVRGLSRTAAVEYARAGIRVNELAPGVVDTPMQTDADALRQFVEASVPQQRVGRPDEVAAAACFLLSDDASYITGTHLAVDGGWLA